VSLDECTCHVCPPCEFCLSLDEDEADALANGGVSAVRELRARREEQAFEEEARDGDTQIKVALQRLEAMKNGK
jgi:hypothetical protein